MQRALLIFITSLWSLSVVSQGPSTVTCPQQFYGIVLPSAATQCQTFETSGLGQLETTLPASLVFFVAEAPQQTQDFFQTQLPALVPTLSIQGRVAMLTPSGNIKIIVSPDNTGSQVDILVTP